MRLEEKITDDHGIVKMIHVNVRRSYARKENFGTCLAYHSEDEGRQNSAMVRQESEHTEQTVLPIINRCNVWKLVSLMLLHMDMRTQARQRSFSPLTHHHHHHHHCKSWFCV
jgi:hypothetical protein